MSTERSREDVWADQVAMAEARGEPIPDEPDASTAVFLLELLAETPPPFPPEKCRGEACQYRERFDPETEQPIGPACGRAATQVIFWKDGGRWSPSCGQHGLKVLDADRLELVLCIHPIEPAVEAQGEPDEEASRV